MALESCSTSQGANPVEKGTGRTKKTNVNRETSGGTSTGERVKADCRGADFWMIFAQRRSRLCEGSRVSDAGFGSFALLLKGSGHCQMREGNPTGMRSRFGSSLTKGH